MGVDINFVQDNNSLSGNIVPFRGLYFQEPLHARGKLARCGRGAIFDLALNIRRGCPIHGQWAGFELLEQNRQQTYMPIDFANGFVPFETISEMIYNCSDYYAPETEGTIRSGKPIPRKKDFLAPFLKDFGSQFIFGGNS